MPTRYLLAALVLAVVVLCVVSTEVGASVDLTDAAVSAGSPTSEIMFLVWFQGYIADPSTGEPVEATYDITAELFDSETVGTSLWGPETHAATGIIDGWFNIPLGYSIALATFTQQAIDSNNSDLIKFILILN